MKESTLFRSVKNADQLFMTVFERQHLSLAKHRSTLLTYERLAKRHKNLKVFVHFEINKFWFAGQRTRLQSIVTNEKLLIKQN